MVFPREPRLRRGIMTFCALEEEILSNSRASPASRNYLTLLILSVITILDAWNP